MSSHCVITFEGLNLCQLLNGLCLQNVNVYKVKRQAKKCRIWVDVADGSKVVALLQKKCYNVLSVSYNGKYALFSYVKKHFVLVVFAVVCLALVAILSQTCLQVQVSGDYDRTLVVDVLQRCNVSVGKVYRNLDVDKVENQLANALDAMYAVVQKRGCVLFVNVVAPKKIAQPIDLHTRRDIVATCDGVVSYLFCEQGTPVVKVGDAVKRGDLLVLGARTFADGSTQPTYALGKVCLTVSASAFVPFDGTMVVSQPCDEQCKRVGVVLFGREYAKPCNFAEYEQSTEQVRLFPLNLLLNYHTYTKVQSVTVPATIDQCKQLLQKQAYDLALAQCNFAVTKTQFDVSSKGVCATLFGIQDIY